MWHGSGFDTTHEFYDSSEKQLVVSRGLTMATETNQSSLRDTYNNDNGEYYKVAEGISAGITGGLKPSIGVGLSRGVSWRNFTAE